VQEALTRAIAKYPDLATRSDAEPLAFGYARFVRLEFLRQRAKYAQLDERFELAAAPPEGPNWERRERCLAAAIEKLSRGCKALFTAMLKGRKNVDIAETLGINVNALYQRINNCKIAIREKMKTTPECEGVCCA
jgi:DNA-directed RNA polymerase specialized sigma24 family protein